MHTLPSTLKHRDREHSPPANYRIILLLLKHLQNMPETPVIHQLKCRISFFFNYSMYHCIFTRLVFSVHLK